MDRLLRIFFLLALAVFPVTAMAQGSTTEAVQMAVEGAGRAGGSSLLEILQKGGPMMYPLGALSFVGVILVVVYTLSLRQGAVVTMRFMDVAESMLRKQDYLGLAAVCNRGGQSVALVMQRAMDFIGRNPAASVEEVREVAQAEGSRQASMMTQRISYLADIGAIAPMVGLLGTVLGMIESFDTLSGGSFVGAKTMKLANGVSQALITTAAGLFVSIPALAFYSYFRGKVQKLISELEAASTHLMAIFAANHDAYTAPPQPRSSANRGARAVEYAEEDEPRVSRRR
ncbi:MAG: MotA/TolQ/ExbB proton channel family protein [Verrucomicrobiales bacterium]